MPQTIANYLGKDGSLSMQYGGVALHRPQLAAMAMHVIEIWSYIDMRLINMVARFLQIDVRVANTMLLSVENLSARRAAVRAAAEHILELDDYRLFNATLSTTRASEARRHQFAHHVWGISDQFPDALLLVDPRHESRLAAQIAQMQARSNLGMPATNEPFSVSESWERIYVFKTEDLADDVERATTASQNVTKLDRFVQAVRDGRQQADAIRGLLLSDPQIEQAVRKSAGRGAED